MSNLESARAVRHAVSYIIYHPDDDDEDEDANNAVGSKRFVIVQRPASDPDLPNVWGLPAGLHQPAPSSNAEHMNTREWEHSVQESGRKKLGVASLRVVKQLGREARLAREQYDLVMRQFICRLDPSAPAIACPQRDFPDVTQYQQWRYGSAEEITEAALKGSLCCQMYLEFIKQSVAARPVVDPRCGSHQTTGRGGIDHAVLIPGNGCGSDLSVCMWYPWLALKLRQELGISITLRGFPDHLYAHESIWKEFVVRELGLTRTTLVIGHSSGAACALRLMEEHQFGACLLVSAYDNDLGDDLERESGYFNRPFDYGRMRDNVKRIVQLHSASDHLVPVAVARRVAKNIFRTKKELEANYVETEDDGHFQADEYSDLLWPLVTSRLVGGE